MKKLLIIALLFVGCDYAPTEHTHIDDSNLLIGKWNLVKTEGYKLSIDVEDYWIFNDTISYTVGEPHSVYDSYYENYYLWLDLKNDGTFEIEMFSDAYSDTLQQSGVWFINGNKLTSLYDGSGSHVTTTSDFEIEDNILIFTRKETASWDHMDHRKYIKTYTKIN